MSNQSKNIDDGGYAFPIPADEKAGWHAEYGMTLRDWFAGQCLSNVGGMWSDEESRDHYAEHCYLQAEAMIKARNR